MSAKTLEELVAVALRERRVINMPQIPDLDGAVLDKLADIGSATELHDALQELIDNNAVALHDSGVSWKVIAESAQITEAAARFRWGSSNGLKAARASVAKPSTAKGLSTAQAATELGISPATMKKRIVDARVGDSETVTTDSFRAVWTPRGAERSSWRIFDIKN
jgi:DNA-directed RNA polymerase specialized sigma24 family protein